MVVQQEGWAVVAAPGVIAGDDMQKDVLHVGADSCEFMLYMIQHNTIVDIDMHLLRLCQCFDKKVVGRIDSLYLPRP